MRDDPAAGLPTPDVGGQADNADAGPRICPFLRAVDDGRLGDPIDSPDEANRCTALGDAAPQSLRQQETACLVSAHANCPRFVRGALVLIDPSSTATDPRRRLTPAILAALLVLAASFVLSVGFVIANGGMDLPAAVGRSPSPDAASGAGATPTTSTGPSAGQVSSPEPSLAATPGPSATPTPTSTAPAAAATPQASSDRFALLEPCPDAPECWIYVVRSGDNLVSIAGYFGIPLEVVTDLNPSTKTTPLVAGQELRLPPPTR